MQTRELGRSGIQASVVAFGAWAIGGWKWGGTDANTAIKAIQVGIDNGINFIDTAAVYGFGLSEELVGKAIESYSRDSVIVATKCGLRWDIESPTLHAESEGKRIFRILDPDSIVWEVEQSLTRLKTDYIDLYQTHWPNDHASAEVVLEVLSKLKEQGKIRAIGFCNAPLDHVQYGADSQLLDVDQEKYSLLDREREHDNLPLCHKANIAFLAYSPMAQGLLTDNLGKPRRFNEGDLRVDNPRFSEENVNAIVNLMEPVKELATQRRVSLEQLVLAWTLQQPGLTHVLAGARSPEQASSNAVAGSLALDEQEIKLISDAANLWQGFS